MSARPRARALDTASTRKTIGDQFVEDRVLDCGGAPDLDASRRSLVIRDWAMPLDEEDRATLTSIRQRFTDCLAALKRRPGDPDAAARSVAEQLGPISTATLPLAAQAIWCDRIARPLKTQPSKPLTARAVAGVRALPARRIAELAAALAEIEALLIETETEALNEAIYRDISHTYS